MAARTCTLMVAVLLMAGAMVLMMAALSYDQWFSTNEGLCQPLSPHLHAYVFPSLSLSVCVHRPSHTTPSLVVVLRFVACVLSSPVHETIQDGVSYTLNLRASLDPFRTSWYGE